MDLRTRRIVAGSVPGARQSFVSRRADSVMAVGNASAQMRAGRPDGSWRRSALGRASCNIWGMDDGGGAVNGRRFGITEAAHQGD